MNPLSSPFHEGELAVQDKTGVRSTVASYAHRVIRPYMPDQHREFFEALPYFFIGSVDDTGLPWASIVWGEPGFVSSPDPLTLRIQAIPTPGEPLAQNLRAGQEVGMLGLQFHSRRRNRINGRILDVSDDSFTVQATQSFGNCPQYIQGRLVEGTQTVSQQTVAPAPEHRTNLSADDKALIAKADTFFIASASGRLGSTVRHGVDMSHRGGKPGFVRLEKDGSLLFPDFSGNNHFNTIGNLHQNPVAGLLFVDFETGDLLQLSGRAEVIWPGDLPYAYDGAQRFIRIEPLRVALRKTALPYRWSKPDMSPFLPEKGWYNTAANELRLQVSAIIDEADGIKSIYLKPEDAPLPSYKPGQHLPLVLNINGETVRRTYTLSAAPGRDAYRITVKREGGGTASRWLHDILQEGDTLVARRPAGSFVWTETDKPTVMLSAGIGITPMLAMAEAMLDDKKSTQKLFFLHGNKQEKNVPFLAQLKRWAAEIERFFLLLRYSSEDASSSPQKGRLDTATLQSFDLPTNATYYLCGPASFMEDTYAYLTGQGVADSNIHFEAFGPSSLKRTKKLGTQTHDPTEVTFERSAKQLTWNPSSETLLEAAEKAGIDAPYSCRSGTCGSCVSTLRAGQVEYTEDLGFETTEQEVLLCCALPKKGTKLIIDL